MVVHSRVILKQVDGAFSDIYQIIDNARLGAKIRNFSAYQNISCVYQGPHSNCMFSVFPVRPQIFHVPIYVTCDYYINETDLADLSSFKRNGNFRGKYGNIFYIKNQGIYNLSIPNSPCFGQIS